MSDVKENAQQEEREKAAVENGVHNYSAEESYVPPTEPKVKEHLEWFQDQKLGLMMHWGAYSQLGLVESWALSDQDAEWSRDGVDWEVSADEFKKEYFALNKTFNPVRFQPEKWAELAADAGFRYLTFTTKHHDGFCMFDSQYSDYKVTAPDCPFHTHRYADICKHLFEAFRRHGMGISAYFSKADWHVPSYWNADEEKGNFTWRGPSYRPADRPELWEEFVEFTQNQVLELCQNYGKIDMLWFDAGWVCEASGQDIRLGEMMDKCRKIQPWVLSADRTIGGPYENVITPEQCVPENPLNVPWESCITMGTSFSFRYEDRYKSGREVICLLIDVVAKGGNLALNVGPQPDGRLPEGAIRTMKEMGPWLQVNGDCIYGTRVCAPYKKDNVAFTQKKDGSAVYAIRVYPDAQEQVEGRIFIPYTEPVSSASLLGEEQTAVALEKAENGYFVTLPQSLLVKYAEMNEAPIALAFQLKK